MIWRNSSKSCRSPRVTICTSPAGVASIVTESLIITTIFGYIGMWLGMVAAEVGGNVLSKVQEGKEISLNIVPSIDIRIVLMATALLIVCGVLAGFFPARNAVKIKPIEAMNYR